MFEKKRRSFVSQVRSKPNHHDSHKRSIGKADDLVRQSIAVLALLIFCLALIYASINYGPQLLKKYIKSSMDGYRQDSTVVRSVGSTELTGALVPLGQVVFVECEVNQVMRDTLREDIPILRDHWVALTVLFRCDLKYLIDFSQVSASDVSIRNGTVTLRLPSPEVRVDNITYSPNEVLTDNQGDIDHDRMLSAIQSLQAMAEDSVIARAQRNHQLIDRCKQNACCFLEECLRSLGDYSIEIAFTNI